MSEREKTSINNENTYMYNLEQLGKVRLLMVKLKYAKEMMDERKIQQNIVNNVEEKE